jgi:hypothetical protein
MVKAPLAREAVGPNPTDRGKKGSKRHILVDVAGVPLALELTGATVHDVKRIQEVLERVVVEGPEWTGIAWEHLCGEKGYIWEPAREIRVLRGYISHVVGGGEERQVWSGIEGSRRGGGWLNGYSQGSTDSGKCR